MIEILELKETLKLVRREREEEREKREKRKENEEEKMREVDLARLEEDILAILEIAEVYQKAGDQKGLEDFINSEMVFNLFFKIKKFKRLRK